jgi:CheY-like chemotaxis protein
MVEGVRMSKPLILVVENDRDICEMLRLVLEEFGYRALIAHSAVEARRFLAGEKPDLLLSDDMMVGERGRDLADYAATLGVPALLISGNPSSQAALDGGPRPFLRKPFHVSTLAQELKRLLAAV